MSITIPSFQDVLNSVMASIAANTVITSGGQVVNPDFSVGSLNLTFSEVIALALDLVYAQVQNTYDGSFVATASGTDLDNLGMIVGLKRIPAGFAQALATITTSTAPITIPTGSIILLPDSTGVFSIPYSTLADIVISGSSATGTVQAVNAGSSSTVTTTVTGAFQSPIAGANSVTLQSLSPPSPGSDAQSDDSYRSAMINNSIINKGTTANIIDDLLGLYDNTGAYVRYATVYVDNSFVYYDGAGQLGFYIQPVNNISFTSAQQASITALIAELRSAGISLQPNASGWTTLASDPVTGSVNIILKDTSQSAVTVSSVQSAITNYLNTLALGSDVIYSEVISAIMSVPNVANQNTLVLTYLTTNYTGDITVAANKLAGPGTFSISWS